MKATKTPPIRVGNIVRIVKPAFFGRCGYPLDFQAEALRVRTEKREVIEAFLRSQGVTITTFYPPKSLDKVAKAIAYDLCKQQGFGGRERKIYTHAIPEHAGKEWTVTRVRFVKTGIYEPGSHWGSEYDPPVLLDEQTHRILELSESIMLPGDPHGFYRAAEIEAVNVEVVPLTNERWKRESQT